MLFNAIDPESQGAIICSDSAGGSPIELNKVGVICDRIPCCVGPPIICRCIIQNPAPYLILVAEIIAKLHLQYSRVSVSRGDADKAVKYGMHISGHHGDRVRIEVKARPVTLLDAGMFTGHFHASAIVTAERYRHTIIAHQLRLRVYGEIAAVRYAGVPGGEYHPIRSHP